MNRGPGRHPGGQPELPALLLAALVVVLSLTPYSVDAFLPAFPAAADALGTDASRMQTTLSVYLIGLALGQFAFGPVSDRLGRRPPLIAGAALCAAAAIGCALAPTVEVLLVARLVQGVAGSAGMVITKAIVRDRATGRAAVHMLTTTAVGSGALAILAPVLGGLLVEAFGWRGPLWLVAAGSLVALALVLVVVPETHPHDRRDTRRGLGFLLAVLLHVRNRQFMLYVLAQACSYGMLMAYVSASPFVYQAVLGFDGLTYGILFSVNASLGVATNLVANRFLRGISSRRLVAMGLCGSLLGTAATGLAVALGAPVWVVAACITASMWTINLNGPNLVGLALERVTASVGSAAATIGFVQFLAGSLVAPIVGTGGGTTILPMLITMTTLGVLGLLLLAGRLPRRRG